MDDELRICYLDDLRYIPSPWVGPHHGIDDRCRHVTGLEQRKPRGFKAARKAAIKRQRKARMNAR